MYIKAEKFLLGLIACMCIDLTGKSLFMAYPEIEQERVYCIWQSVSFAAYILLIFFLVREYGFRPLTFLAFNWFGFALSDLYQEVWGDPYRTNLFEYIPLYLTIIITTYLLIKNPK